ncbi:hypothetical protein EDM54_01725 [Brevibacillus borstelensis]|uniref:hypothetical protein n=1 Tax=Brevibacillus borstelensis TaxID=45462 RepID=UPI000F08E4C1|nr:hypothetical protein [Brevibacillus borstelensis]MED1881054.1 hypothetical protein [Brevibacillus borstelensis]RNB66416.1 hypothetical protein EDM54_01725 [Brevibacillus borstelensis]GED53731.1 hypothetical protein BBO01nite_29720 [Brevibacillus borstelensis]
MRYRKRNPDGTFGDWVETPGHTEGLAPEVQMLLETVAFMDMEMTSLKERVTTLEAEVKALKGGGQ